MRVPSSLGNKYGYRLAEKKNKQRNAYLLVGPGDDSGPETVIVVGVAEGVRRVGSWGQDESLILTGSRSPLP